MTRFHSAIVAAVLFVLNAAARANEVEMTYLGNEGFLLEALAQGEGAEGNDRPTKILIDALVARDMPAYVRQSDELRRKLERAEAPFDDVDLVLVTHVHGDHFGAESLARHLAANTNAHAIGTEQVVEQLRKRSDFPPIEARVHAAAPGDEPLRFERWSLDVYNMHHGKTRRPPIQNNGYVFELGGQRFLHMGDTEVTAEELAEMDVASLELDVAMVPSWYFDARPWKGAIERSIQPRQAVVMHLAPDWKDQSKTRNQRESRARVPRIRAAYPDAIVFEAPLETKRFEAD